MKKFLMYSGIITAVIGLAEIVIDINQHIWDSYLGFNGLYSLLFGYAVFTVGWGMVKSNIPYKIIPSVIITFCMVGVGIATSNEIIERFPGKTENCIGLLVCILLAAILLVIPGSKKVRPEPVRITMNHILIVLQVLLMSIAISFGIAGIVTQDVSTRGIGIAGASIFVFLFWYVHDTNRDRKEKQVEKLA